MGQKIGVIDLFAGPGGLGEGFSAFRTPRSDQPFRLEMSVEMEASAHRTLELRAFYRQFRNVPEAYYQYIRGEISREALFAKYPAKAKAAQAETLGGPLELGKAADDEQIHSRLRQLTKAQGREWIVIGGPPCQAYSLVGRARNKGIAGYKAKNDKRHFLYEEYLAVLDKVHPAAFILENVKGILSSKVGRKLIFPRLLDDLRCPGRAVRGKRASPKYRVFSLITGTELDDLTGTTKDLVIRTEDYGVPQSRHRVILLGIRNDISRQPGPLRPAGASCDVESAIGDLPRLRSGLSRTADTAERWRSVIASQARVVRKELSKRSLSTEILDNALDLSSQLCSRGGRFVQRQMVGSTSSHLHAWLQDSAIGGFVNHETRGHMELDLARYLYCACFAALQNGRSPTSRDFPDSLAPEHRSWLSDDFVDRFKVQGAKRRSSTVTSHIAKDGHYFIHYEPGQCRSLTVREAARLQTFSDNYFFEGNRTEQFVQVGNAVPPWLALQIAHVVWNLF